MKVSFDPVKDKMICNGKELDPSTFIYDEIVTVCTEAPVRDFNWFFIPADSEDGGTSLDLAKRTITLSKANQIIRESGALELLAACKNIVEAVNNADKTRRLYLDDCFDEIEKAIAKAERKEL